MVLCVSFCYKFRIIWYRTTYNCVCVNYSIMIRHNSTRASWTSPASTWVAGHTGRLRSRSSRSAAVDIGPSVIGRAWWQSPRRRRPASWLLSVKSYRSRARAQFLKAPDLCIARHPELFRPHPLSFQLFVCVGMGGAILMNYNKNLKSRKWW